MWLLGKKSVPFEDEFLRRVWVKWNDKNNNTAWQQVSNTLYSNLFESIIAFAEIPGVISAKEANKARQKAKISCEELAKVSFYIGLECKSQDPGIGERIEAGGEIPPEVIDGLKKAIQPAYGHAREIIIRQHNPLSSVDERDKTIADLKRVLSEQSFLCFQKGLA